MAETKSNIKPIIIAASILAVGIIIAAVIIGTRLAPKNADKTQTNGSVDQNQSASAEGSKQTTVINCDFINSVIADSKYSFEHFKGKYLRKIKPINSDSTGKIFSTNATAYKCFIQDAEQYVFFEINIYEGNDETRARQLYDSVLANTNCMFNKETDFKQNQNQRTFTINSHTEVQVNYYFLDGSYHTIVSVNNQRW